MTQDTDIEIERSVPRSTGLPKSVADAMGRLRLRASLVAGAMVVLGAFVLFGGLFWQAGLAGAVLAFGVAAVCPHTNLISSRRIGQEQLDAGRRRKAIFDDILQALPHPAILLTSEGTIAGYNATAHEHWSNLRRGSHLSLIIRQPLLLDAVLAVSGGAKPATVNYTERVPVERRIEATVANLPWARKADPQGPSILVTLRDLSEQERLNQMRADFVANASHELRTPLSSLLGFIETLQGPAREDKAASEKFLGIMETQAQRMTRLIDDLLSLSRVEMNVHLQPTETVDLCDTVAHVTEALSPVADEAQIKLVTKLPRDRIPIRGDRDELVQLMQNLVQNAIKYGKQNGRIKVSVSQVPGNAAGRDRVCVAVEDNGPGIPPEHLPRLTERFYRVDVASSREKGGTGLGLAIVKHIVMRHRGDLQITSDLGKGSTFSVIFDEVGTNARSRTDMQAEKDATDSVELDTTV